MLLVRLFMLTMEGNRRDFGVRREQYRVGSLRSEQLLKSTSGSLSEQPSADRHTLLSLVGRKL